MSVAQISLVVSDAGPVCLRRASREPLPDRESHATRAEQAPGSPTRISYETSQSPGEQHDAGGVKEIRGRGDGAFEVLGEPAVAVDPGEESLDRSATQRRGSIWKPT